MIESTKRNTGDGSLCYHPKQFPSIEQAFPNLFEKEEQQNWILMKERVEAYAKAKKQQNSADI